MTPHSEALEPVLRLAAQGWRLLPCAERGKVALLKDWPRRASCDPRVISAWAEKHEGCNWAVACGPESGIWVLDVDGEPGSASLASLIQTHGEDWAKTLTAATARGFHLYFAWPPTRTVRTSAGKLAAGLDVRGAGGYVLIPPSVHPTGEPYEWRILLNELPAPAWLLELVTSAGRPVVQTSEIGILPEGRRNDGLTRLAGAMRRKGATLPQIETALFEHNGRRCRPPLSDSEVRKIVASASRWEPGGPDPLESAWQAIGDAHSSSYERFVALARQLQSARPGLPFALPSQRIAELFGCHWTLVGRYRKRAVLAGVMRRVGDYIPHRKATQYELVLSEGHSETAKGKPTKPNTPTPGSLTNALTSGLVRHPVRHEEIPLVRQTLVRHEDSPSETDLSTISSSGNGGASTRVVTQEPTEPDYVSALGRGYPGQEIPDQDAIPPSFETIIANAVRRDGGQTILDGLSRWRCAYHFWPPAFRERIPTQEQWYSEAYYLKDPAQWTPAQDGDSATAGCSFLRAKEHDDPCPMK